MEIVPEGESDTESDTSAEERTIGEIVNKRLDTTKCTSHVLSLLKDRQRNNAFVNVVLDRRGNRVPRLVCCTEDTVLTLDTGTDEVDFHIRERKDYCFNIGDDLTRCAKQWPQTDREGIFKDKIQKLSTALIIAMGIVRPAASEAEATRSQAEALRAIRTCIEELRDDF